MKQALLITAAGLAGFLGGVLGGRFKRTGEPVHAEDVIRARSFELVDVNGEVISYWGVDKGQNIVLAFGGLWPDRPGGKRTLPGDSHLGLKDPRNQLASIGVVGDFPVLQFRAEDGKPRARLLLSMFEKPMLLMDDETGVRLLLGIEQSDAPSPEDNSWALKFEPERAWIGMAPEKVGGITYVQGGFGVRNDRLKYPYQQAK